MARSSAPAHQRSASTTTTSSQCSASTTSTTYPPAATAMNRNEQKLWTWKNNYISEPRERSLGLFLLSLFVCLYSHIINVTLFCSLLHLKEVSPNLKQVLYGDSQRETFLLVSPEASDRSSKLFVFHLCLDDRIKRLQINN